MKTKSSFIFCIFCSIINFSEGLQAQDIFYLKQPVFVSEKSILFNPEFQKSTVPFCSETLHAKSIVPVNFHVNRIIKPIAFSNDFQGTKSQTSHVIKCALFGTLIGVGTGMLIGLSLGNDPPCPTTGVINPILCEINRQTAWEKATAWGLGLGITGALTGTIIGIAIPIE